MFLLLAGAMGGVPILSAYLSIEDQFALQRTAFVIFVIAASTDWVDGWLARRWNATSRWGAILDPIADKVLVTGTVIGVLASGTTPTTIIPFGLILFREFAVSALRESTAGRVELPVTLLAKWKTALQMIALGLQLLVVVLRERFIEEAWYPGFTTAADLFLWFAALVTLWTGWQYFSTARKALRQP
ncbi:MAG: CDP-diacylglycerol--glycerol-3-phosphate 3-phosphatidyltransferase [Brevundimonas sp.]|uniref:CDP-diacylglycerol--glycerol-3-phosphate 3-phosphatidyltransferase n=1 Tax=Brevundimonas sp. TaxID=1871086 RepID=UPI00391C911B